MEAAESTEASEGSTIVLSENASGETRAELKVLMARQMRWRSPFREAPTSLEERPFRGEAPKGGAPPKGGEVILERGVLGGRGRGAGRGGGRGAGGGGRGGGGGGGGRAGGGGGPPPPRKGADRTTSCGAP